MPSPRHFMCRKAPAVRGTKLSDKPVVVSHEFAPEEDVLVDDLDGCLKVTTERLWDLEVPHDIVDFAPRRFVDMANPHDQCGPLLREQVPVVTGNDYDSFMAAFNKRCNTVHVDDIDDGVYSAAYDIISAMDVSGIDPWDENEGDRLRWLAKFNDQKRVRMEEAWTQVDGTDHSHLGTKDLSVKQEVLLKRNDPSWAPRVIYAGNDVFNAVTGPPMMVAMERLCKVFDNGPLSGITFLTAYKQSDTRLAEFISEDTTLKHLVEGDYSANDKEQRKRVHLLFDHFLNVVKMPNWLRTLHRKINTFKVQSRAFGLKARLENQLPTGTTATTVRNSMYNAVMFCVAMSRQKAKGRALVLGDDLLANLDRRIRLPDWVDTINLFRMKLKAKAPSTWGAATFLSRRLIVDDVEKPCMVPLLGKAIARFNARGTWRADKNHSQYMAGKALSYAYEFRHVPFMRDFFLDRYYVEDNSKLDLDDLTWHAKTGGVTVDNVAQSILDEDVLIDDDLFAYWVMETYDLDFQELQSICEEVLLSGECSIIDHCAVPNLAIDW